MPRWGSSKRILLPNTLLCPEHESDWFRQNSISAYNTDLTLNPDNLLDDSNNVVLPQSNLHAAFDDREFVFYPKDADTFVVHIVEPTPNLAQLYHNVEI